MNGPVVLLILDGWGIAAPWGGNAIALAKAVNMQRLEKSAPYTTLAASGEAVGLPPDEPGNSEVGHLTIGAGKIIKQDLPLINDAITQGSFFDNSELTQAVKAAKKGGAKLHLVGLVSSGGVHSHLDHLLALIDLAKKYEVKNSYIHMITDGRDTSPYAGIIYLNRLEQKIRETGIGEIATVMGRYYAMDRDARWQRTKQAYEAMTAGSTRQAATAQAAIATAYQESFTDEFIPPTSIVNDGKLITIASNDVVISFNFRPDRARQLTKAFVLPVFTGFLRKHIPLHFVTMTEYEKGLPVRVAFRPEPVEHPLTEVISRSGLIQLHVGETEKYAHVTYFLNGQKEQPFPGEARILVPSPKIATYDLAPEMSAALITQTVINNLKKKHYDFIVVNFANCDMVGHTGNLKATIRACEVVDEAVGKIVNAVASQQGHTIITADHGNAEQKLNPKTGDVDTAHTANPVPFILLSPNPSFSGPLKEGGGLSDVAPTLLTLLGLSIPSEMTGTPLFSKTPAGVKI